MHQGEKLLCSKTSHLTTFSLPLQSSDPPFLLDPSSLTPCLKVLSPFNHHSSLFSSFPFSMTPYQHHFSCPTSLSSWPLSLPCPIPTSIPLILHPCLQLSLPPFPSFLASFLHFSTSHLFTHLLPKTFNSPTPSLSQSSSSAIHWWREFHGTAITYFSDMIVITGPHIQRIHYSLG